jgi:hypothetical protein
MRRRIAALLLLAVAAVGVSGCSRTSPSPQATPAGAGAPPARPSPYVLLDLRIDKGAVTPTDANLQVMAGQPIVVRVTSDEYDELQVGSSPDLPFGINPRVQAPQVFQFTIDVPGQVDIELLRESGCPSMCSRTHLSDMTVATLRVQPSPATRTTEASIGTGLHEPCELLSQSMAEMFAGDDAQRQPWGDTGCYYKGSTRSVLFTIGPWPSSPDAPVNHFHAIRPENRIPGVPYEAYWFAAADSLLVVKNDLLLGFRVSDNPFTPNAQINQHRKAEDIALADRIVPRVG